MPRVIRTTEDIPKVATCRIKVILRRAHDDRPLFWLRYDRSKPTGGIYCGLFTEYGEVHSSWHADGSRKLSASGIAPSKWKGEPLDSIKGVVQMGMWGISLEDIEGFYATHSVLEDINEADELIWVDQKYFHTSRLNIHVFLLQPKTEMPCGVLSVEPNPKLHLFNQLEPWVAVLLSHRKT